MNLTIKQSTTSAEILSSPNVVEALYRLTKPDPSTGLPSADAVLRGRIQVPAAYEDAVSFLNTQFSADNSDNGSDFQITVLNNNYYIRFADPEVVRVLVLKGVMQEGVGLTTTQTDDLPAGGGSANESWWKNNTTIKEFDEIKYFGRLKNGAHQMGQWFTNATNLESVDLTGFTAIKGFLLFDGCKNLEYFHGRNNPPNTLNLEDLTQLAATFKGCLKLYHIASLGSITNIGDSVFDGCTNLETVNLPSSCINLVSNCFKSDSKLHTINLSHVTAIGHNTFNGCSSLEYCDGPNSTQGELNLPNLTGTLGSSTFENCNKLTSIASLGSITSIGNFAFQNCTNLATINFPSTITSVGANAFNNTAWYNNQPDGLICIGNGLYKCKNMSGAVVIPNNISSIASEAFRGCSGITSVTIPNSVTSIGDRAFYECTGLTSMIIPSNITSIGGSAFEECRNLVSLTIPNSVTSMGNSAFRHCYKLKALHFPNGATSVPYGCCSDDYELEDVVIPEGYTSIQQYGFVICTSLQTITLPSTITTIGPQALAGCTSLTEVTVLATNPPSINSNVFVDSNNLTSIHVPAGSVSAYQSASGWSTYAGIIQAIPTT